MRKLIALSIRFRILAANAPHPFRSGFFLAAAGGLGRGPLQGKELLLTIYRSGSRARSFNTASTARFRHDFWLVPSVAYTLLDLGSDRY
jgi:hypothetical protein